MISQDLTSQWIKKRKMENTSSISTIHDQKMAREIFKAWDVKLRRYILFEEFAENVIGLGLAPDSKFVRKIFKLIKGENNPNPDQIDLKEFLKIFEPDRFGQKVSM